VPIWKSGFGMLRTSSGPTPGCALRNTAHRSSVSIFLRFAEARFAGQRAKLEQAGGSSRRGFAGG